MLEQHTANQRTKRRPAGTHCRPDAERDVAIFRVDKQRADPRKRSRNNHRRTNRQRGARRYQPPCRRCKRGRQGRQAKQRAADHQQAFKANAVTEGTHRQHHPRHHQRVNINDPQQFVSAGTQRHAQCRRRHVQHRRVNRHRDVYQHDNH